MNSRYSLKLSSCVFFSFYFCYFPGLKDVYNGQFQPQIVFVTIYELSEFTMYLVTVLADGRNEFKLSQYKLIGG